MAQETWSISLLPAAAEVAAVAVAGAVPEVCVLERSLSLRAIKRLRSELVELVVLPGLDTDRPAAIPFSQALLRQAVDGVLSQAATAVLEEGRPKTAVVPTQVALAILGAIRLLKEIMVVTRMLRAY